MDHEVIVGNSHFFLKVLKNFQATSNFGNVWSKVLENTMKHIFKTNGEGWGVGSESDPLNSIDRRSHYSRKNKQDFTHWLNQCTDAHWPIRQQKCAKQKQS